MKLQLVQKISVSKNLAGLGQKESLEAWQQTLPKQAGGVGPC